MIRSFSPTYSDKLDLVTQWKFMNATICCGPLCPWNSGHLHCSSVTANTLLTDLGCDWRRRDTLHHGTMWIHWIVSWMRLCKMARMACVLCCILQLQLPACCAYPHHSLACVQDVTFCGRKWSQLQLQGLEILFQLLHGSWKVQCRFACLCLLAVQ